MVYGILVPWPGTEPAPSELEVQNLNQWTAREIPPCDFIIRLGSQF